MRPGSVKSASCTTSSRRLDERLARAKNLDFRPLRMAIDDLIKTFGAEYPAGPEYRARLAAIEQALAHALAQVGRDEPASLGTGQPSS